MSDISMRILAPVFRMYTHFEEFRSLSNFAYLHVPW